MFFVLLQGIIILGSAKNMEENQKIKWHPGFYAGIEYELRKYKNALEYESEHVLSKEPIKLDLLVIKKREGIVINNSFGKMFRNYNVIEYKSPKDELTIDTLYKTIAYGCLYKCLSTSSNKVQANDITISMFRNGKPRKMFKELEKLGAKITKQYDGVYYLTGIINFPVQVVVMNELGDSGYEALKILRFMANESDIRKFIDNTSDCNDLDDKANIDAILQVSVSANYETYEKIRRETTMCEALRELMKDEIQKDVEQGVRKAVILARYDDGMELELIASKSNMSIDEVKRILSENGKL